MKPMGNTKVPDDNLNHIDIPRRIFRTIKNIFGNNGKNPRIHDISFGLSIKFGFS